MSILAKNVPRCMVYYQKQVGDFGDIFVRKHPLAPGLHCEHGTDTDVGIERRSDLSQPLMSGYLPNTNNNDMTCLLDDISHRTARPRVSS